MFFFLLVSWGKSSSTQEIVLKIGNNGELVIIIGNEEILIGCIVTSAFKNYLEQWFKKECIKIPEYEEDKI